MLLLRTSRTMKLHPTPRAASRTESSPTLVPGDLGTDSREETTDRWMIEEAAVRIRRDKYDARIGD
ncbi:hypothetical protein FRC18_006599 [Serendipita sp. 400]|nr:hypothetical protein FRC18_006599 [Serendipita sp. 400]